MIVYLLHVHLLFLASILCVAQTYRKDLRFLELLPKANFRLKENTKLVVNCTSRSRDEPKHMYWNASRKSSKMMSKQVDTRTVALTIEVLHRSDAGSYTCHLELPDGSKYQKTVHVIVTPDARPSCSHTQFRCKSGHCIFQQFRCDRKMNCPDNSDEDNCDHYSASHPCGPKFRCANGRCIRPELVCDKFHEDNCGDGSDELCQTIDIVKFPQYNTDTGSVSTSHPRQTSVNDQMESLKMTVYSVIGCIVGIMLFIAILLIAIFRVKMRRAAARRQLFFLERRRRDNSAAHRPYERDPFLGGSHGRTPPYRYSNIILNVNNGVQYVPGMEFTSLVEAPPAYSEAMSEDSPVPSGRNSPPPPYSTVDRGTRRGPELFRGDNSRVASRRGTGRPGLSLRGTTNVNRQNTNTKYVTPAIQECRESTANQDSSSVNYNRSPVRGGASANNVVVTASSPDSNDATDNITVLRCSVSENTSNAATYQQDSSNNETGDTSNATGNANNGTGNVNSETGNANNETGNVNNETSNFNETAANVDSADSAEAVTKLMDNENNSCASANRESGSGNGTDTGANLSSINQESSMCSRTSEESAACSKDSNTVRSEKSATGNTDANTARSERFQKTQSRTSNDEIQRRNADSIKSSTENEVYCHHENPSNEQTGQSSEKSQSDLHHVRDMRETSEADHPDRLKSVNLGNEGDRRDNPHSGLFVSRSFKTM